MKKWFTLHRLRSGWESYRIPACGSGLPFYCCLVLLALVENWGLHPGLWILGVMVACEVEAWSFHSKNGTLSIIDRPAGLLWSMYGVFGVFMSGMFFPYCNDHVFLLLVQVHAGIAAFFLMMAVACFIGGLKEADSPGGTAEAQ